MWAAIGIYRGREDNTFYRRGGTSLISSGGKQVTDGAVLMLGDDVIQGRRFRSWPVPVGEKARTRQLVHGVIAAAWSPSHPCIDSGFASIEVGL
jgi:hypothetical protein